ncbi:heparan-sulfate 6-O-sulfotransferase 2 isoform X1 [Diabrotica virgifera virgifera]|uniref:Heparan-sulfate 6-O-sulfotransferase n=1 Tax=Diabrotica virgifera virgifera TaxID=50390 RepID=A0A6P7FNS8_DIAVI|nr:heparan-sulfate 6-O-sulfotransferase 2 isoform X1 [Diabrotica virgifera virgifera]
MKNLKSVSVQVVNSDLALLLPNGVYEIKQMESRSSRLKQICLFCLVLCIFGIFGFGYFCPDKVCALSSREAVYVDDNLGKPLAHTRSKVGLSYDDMLNDDFTFDMDSHDVVVFLHMQKTGGTSFGKHLVHDLDLKRPCTCPISRKRCYCFRPHSNQSWLFSRYTTGWKCGLHADWTELTTCVDEKLDELEDVVKRRYFYITLLREPVARYLSEFRHVQRGATWKGSRHFCNGRLATDKEVPPCYKGEDWEGVKLDDFMNCQSNLAVNRQTRMLSDLELIGCYNKTYMPQAERDKIMLASAKKNLLAMAFFGLTEYQKISQYIFEETFNLRFAIPFEQNNATVSSYTLTTLTSAQSEKIKKLNNLDLELYSFAKKILFERFERLKSRDADFKGRFKNLGVLNVKQGPTEFDWDKLEDPTDSP